MEARTDMIDNLREYVSTAIESNAVELRKLSDDIWRRPELGFQEHFACDAICSVFAASGAFHVERKYAGIETAFKVTYSACSADRCGTEAGTGPNVAFICEYDALPEIGHACGHNLIAEAGVAAGFGLQAALAASQPPCSAHTHGTVAVVGCPAEEGGGGKVALLKAGAFAGVDAAIMIHPSNCHIVRPNKLAQNFAVVSFRGRPAHSCCAPWEGINALDAATSAYCGLSLLRQQMRPTWRVHAVITEGGTEPWIIPEKATMHAFARAPSVAELMILKAKVHAIFQSAATTTGCSVDIEWSSKEAAYYANLVTNPTISDVFERHFTSLGLVDSKSTAFGGSTDMGNVSYAVPSIHPMVDIGTSAKQHTRPFQVASGTDVAQTRTLLAAKAMALTGLDLMLEPQLLVRAKEELRAQVALMTGGV